MHLEATHAVEITKSVECVDRKEDPLIQAVRTHQHNTDSQCYRQLDASRQKYRKKQENEGQQSGENKRKMVREEDAWTIAT